MKQEPFTAIDKVNGNCKCELFNYFTGEPNNYCNNCGRPNLKKRINPDELADSLETEKGIESFVYFLKMARENGMLIGLVPPEPNDVW